jgi:hypothetical protein
MPTLHKGFRKVFDIHSLFMCYFDLYWQSIFLACVHLLIITDLEWNNSCHGSSLNLRTECFTSQQIPFVLAISSAGSFASAA